VDDEGWFVLVVVSNWWVWEKYCGLTPLPCYAPRLLRGLPCHCSHSVAPSGVGPSMVYSWSRWFCMPLMRQKHLFSCTHYLLPVLPAFCTLTILFHIPRLPGLRAIHLPRLPVRFSPWHRLPYCLPLLRCPSVLDRLGDGAGVLC